MYFKKTFEQIIKFISSSLILNIVNTAIAICAVAGIFVSIYQANDNHKLIEINNKSLEITNFKYLQENRPYIYFDSVEWVGQQDNFFSLDLKNPGQFPANITLTFSIKDSFSNEIYNDKKDGIVIFPYNQSKKIEIGYNTIVLTSKDNPKRTITLTAYGKPIKKIQELLDAGEDLNFTITSEYTSLLGGKNTASLDFKYTYKQKFLLYKSSSSIILKNMGIEAD